ncbi:MAG: hypothetical protein ACFWT0_01585 [Bifidobacterium crudilactis]|jgi:xanthine dehydrogenase iron-sulfur cluster and FAD-binding subunit A|uniref:hypothetical protein n=1 Tax=Bifidobacterium crudilactis TaxID=327277 RepID=UPI003A5B9D0A
MDWNVVGEEIGTISAVAFGAFGFITAIIALFQTRKANKLAKRANALAEKANRIAEEASTISRTANDIASKSNQISGDANTISRRALSATTDQTSYNWRFKYNKESSAFTIINDCANTAHDVLIVVRHKDETLLNETVDNIPGFGKNTFEIKFLTQQIIEDQRRIDRINDRGGVFLVGAGKVRIVIDLVWTSELGLRKSEQLEQTFR